ncbi:PAS domain S-box protein [Halorubrum halophilum]|uniref:PAS domain S-box protein n=1 Tax=Halorubrum halophilum TaxID=413816 RepID=UPI0006796433|nr:PAS domain S-box protein [Halorubrum halophilum]
MTTREDRRSDALAADTRSEPVRVLLVADQPAVGDRAASAIEARASRFAVTAAADATEGLGVVDSGEVDCVVSGYDLPGMDGVEFLRAVRDRVDDLPFVLFTARGSEAVASEAVAAGVDEYLPVGGDEGHADTEDLADTDDTDDTDDPYATLASRVERVVSRSHTECRVTEHLDRMTDAFCGIDESWRLSYLNEQAAELLDRDADDLLGDRIWDRFEALRGTELEERFREAMATGEPADFEFHFDGPDLDLAIDAYPSDTGLSVYFRDVTEKKQRERDLERYRRLVDELPDSVALYDADGRFAVVNDRLTEVYDSTREALVGRKSPLLQRLRETSDNDPFAALVSGDRETLSGSVELDLADRSDAIVDFGLRRLVIDGEFDGVLGVARDVTEKRRRQRELERTSARLEALFEDSPDMIDIHDEAGEIVDANPVMAAELGYDREEIAGMDVWEIDAELDPAEGIDLWQRIEMGETRRLETTFRRADDTTFPVEVHVRRVDVRGEDRFLATSRDISERKAYERRIERENERLDEFANIVSHDLRNPLNVLSGYLRLARETGNESYFDRCDTALDEMERLIDDVLTLARQGDAVGSVDPVPLGELATRYANEALGSIDGVGDDDDGGREDETAGSIEIAVETERDVLADPGRLKRLLQNLFRNAAEHGGDRVVVGDLPNGFYVEDDGPGIPEDCRDEVFESGHTTSESGTGFGLAIVERIAEAHGWEVTLTEGDDGGARFEFTGVERP